MTIKPARAYAAVYDGEDGPCWQGSETEPFRACIYRNKADAVSAIGRQTDLRIERVVVLREADYLELVKKAGEK